MVGDVYAIKSQLYGFNGNMLDWHVFPEMGGGMLYDRGVHLIGQILIKPAQVCRVLPAMEAVRESARTGKAIAFEK